MSTGAGAGADGDSGEFAFFGEKVSQSSMYAVSLLCAAYSIFFCFPFVFNIGVKNTLFFPLSYIDSNGEYP